MSARRRISLIEIVDDLGDEPALALCGLELQFEQAQRIQDERILLSTQRTPQMIHFFHRGLMKIENQLEGFQLIEQIARRIGRERSRRDVVLREYVLELE